MYRIVYKKRLNDFVTEMHVHAPLVASKAKAGQFIILRATNDGERIPLTIAGTDRENGSVSIIFQTVGATTLALSTLEVGDSIPDFVGPLGMPTEIDGISRVLVVGGGVGCAIALPVARALKENGCHVTSVIGFRSRDLVILEDEFRAVSDELIIMTDDGSYGERGNVCLPIERLLSTGTPLDHAFVIGPLVMMKFAVAAMRPYNLPVTVSMNPIMIDGTGMCGGCRLTLNIDGSRVMKFACVDGPDFDGYAVDFDEAISRLSAYSDFERHAHTEACNLLKKGGNSNG